jgi:hypothetical protein
MARAASAHISPVTAPQSTTDRLKMTSATGH